LYVDFIIDGHTYIAEDCGAGVKGNRIDVYFDTHQKALDFVYPYGKIKKVVKVML
jgi:3D (Asp-Asp-Asp) domain-containing protein